MSVILETRGLTKKFGGVTAVGGLDVVVNESEILGLIGPNGSGKTTVFSMISGFQQPTSGEILFEGCSLVGKPAHAVTKLGIARLFQQSLLFSNISVLENVIIGFHCSRKASLLGSIVGMKSARSEESEFETRAIDILESVGLGRLKDELAVNLPHGYQRLLSVAISLATSPRLLLLDEPVTGMNDEELRAMAQIIQAIRRQGITVMLVEHRMKVVTDVCDRVVVLNYGRKIAEGTPTLVCQDPEVCAAYLGKGTFDAV